MIAGYLENIYILTLKKRQWLFWLDFRANLTRLVGRDHREHVWFRMQWRVDKKGHSPQATRWATGYWAKTRTSKTEGLVAIKLFKTTAAILRIIRNHSCNTKNTKKPQLQLFPTGTDEPKWLTWDSCLWAYVERWYCWKKERSGESSEGRDLNDSHGLCMEYLLTGESTLINVVNWLWPQMTVPQQETSPFGSVIHYPLQTA